MLALQGDVAEHLAMLDRVGATPVAVKHARQLDDVDGLVIPGGESTTIGKLLTLFDLLDPLKARIGEGLAVFGTCAGAILLASEATQHDGSPTEQPLLGAMDTTVRRNAFGRQIDSFEADVTVSGISGPPMKAVFIRAPAVQRAGPDVDVLATVPSVPQRGGEGEAGGHAGRSSGDTIVVCRQGRLLASSFHPELTDDPRLHEFFVDLVR